MQGDAAVERLQSGCETVLLRDVDDVFRDVEGRLGQLLDQRIVGQDQRPFEFHHQRAGWHQRNDVIRSEEHTSELQSLMRISYAVFCLKQKTNKQLKYI